jgi:hypothetical protein
VGCFVAKNSDPIHHLGAIEYVLPQEQPSTFYLTDIFFIAGFVMYIAYHPSLPLYL